ncbi:methylenetetrahydrofolate reductase [NAD(P)H] [Vagococcus fluvialis]|uniref:Methylenetetrahydrofolate reductase n=1 Tax=Vagococcus fluvialis TaxID=2738 RepID=A0A7X6D7Z6_9ENTE|nr:methylenetetrahydrofolate reductase [NAD(P)H] [Vagococcus fluvialis]NKC67516.1 methylenetetrahydrofolate reductase [NAD(P)H] [Vagococcus fluvialis]
MTQNKLSPTLSFEVFPPNSKVGTAKLIDTLDDFKELAPSFISVTCSNSALNVEETTVSLSGYIKQELSIPSVAHLPATYLTKERVLSVLNQLDKLGVNHLLALRGDEQPTQKPCNDFKYASDLITFVKEYAPQFHISGACYPEVHPDSRNRVEDIQFLKRKTDAGCDTLISQLFFDNNIFYRFQENCALANIEKPILAGVMPIVNRNQALRLFKTNGTHLPKKFLQILDRYEHHPEALRDAGLAYAVDQIVEFVTQNVDGIHLYTMNNSATANYIYQTTSSLFKTQKELLTV